MRSARIQQAAFTLGTLACSAVLLNALGVILTLTDRPLWINTCGLLLSLSFLAGATVVSKAGIWSMLRRNPPRWVNTAAGVRRDDEENGHSAQPADGGVLQWKSSILGAGFYVFMMSFIMLADIFRAAATVIAATVGSGSVIPLNAVLHAQQEGRIESSIIPVGLDVLIMGTLLIVARKKHGLKGVPFLTLLAALLSSHGHAPTYGSFVPKSTFVDPSSGRVRRIYRESNESFEPSTAKATSRVSSTRTVTAGA